MTREHQSKERAGTALLPICPSAKLQHKNPLQPKTVFPINCHYKGRVYKTFDRTPQST